MMDITSPTPAEADMTSETVQEQELVSGTWRIPSEQQWTTKGLLEEIKFQHNTEINQVCGMKSL